MIMMSAILLDLIFLQIYLETENVSIAIPMSFALATWVYAYYYILFRHNVFSVFRKKDA